MKNKILATVSGLSALALLALGSAQGLEAFSRHDEELLATDTVITSEPTPVATEVGSELAENTTTEEKAEPSAPAKVETQPTPKTLPPAKQEVATPPAQTQPKEDLSQFETYGQYEVTMLGVCPSERPQNNWSNNPGRYLNAIGVIVTGENRTTPLFTLRAAVEAAWDYFQIHGSSFGDTRKYWLGPLTAAGYPDEYRYYKTSANLNWEEQYVWVEGLAANDPDVIADVADANNYLHSLTARFKAKCPND